jgi:hypothetical protein
MGDLRVGVVAGAGGGQEGGRHHRRKLTDEERARREWSRNRLAFKSRLTPEQCRLAADNLALAGWAIQHKPFQWMVAALGHDEAEQIAYVAIMRAAQMFDPNVGRFSTLAGRWMYFYLIQAAKRVLHDRQAIPTISLHYNHNGQESRNDIEADLGEEPSYENEDDAVERWEDVKRWLTPKELEAVEMTAKHGSQLAAGRALGIECRQVINARLLGARKKLKALGYKHGGYRVEAA